MYKCPECGEEVDEDDVEYGCPFCYEIDYGEGFYTCENCGTLFDQDGDLWECQFCHNRSDSEGYYPRCPECGETLEDESYCYSCGWPNNQGWIGEHYG